MTEFQEEDRIKELEALISKARDEYYNKTPTVDDAVYDAWVDELSDLTDLDRVQTNRRLVKNEQVRLR